MTDGDLPFLTIGVDSLALTSKANSADALHRQLSSQQYIRKSGASHADKQVTRNHLAITSSTGSAYLT